MILIRPNLKAENISISREKNGRVLIVNLTLQDEEYCLANIYVPNDQSHQVDFYTQLMRKLRPHPNANLILGGDFNCPLEDIDKIGREYISRKNAIQSVVEMSNNLNLVDFWRLQRPFNAQFTWKHLRKGKMKIRLLAYFEALNSSH